VNTAKLQSAAVDTVSFALFDTQQYSSISLGVNMNQIQAYNVSYAGVTVTTKVTTNTCA